MTVKSLETKITILDGGMGRELELRGAPFKQPEWSALAMIEAPETVKEVHKAFIKSGASVITTNSYALVPFHIGEERFKNQGRLLAATAGQVARAAVKETQTNTRVAGSIPPLFGSYRADLYQADRVAEIATPLIEGLGPYVDLWLCETQSLVAEAVRVTSLIRSLDKGTKPIWVSFSLEDAVPTPEPLLRSGESIVSAVKSLSGLEVDAILFNCCQPEVIRGALQVARETLVSAGTPDLELGAYANAFSPQLQTLSANEGLNKIRTDLTPSAYLHWAQQWRDEGATLIGGCCGIGPDHIAMLAEQLHT
ncbi:homocysteine S-methyltransferase family protein [Geopsychrobacter electrodiphilus]|uniref:homocysteine S-methyltransferase family protein n=1 Tax=Geopsychrobacter electrodiphilus TaxID=225196 RepID=UPI0003819103|nr:homocysteine S-methyltransferase family protein [Geopsychrobacter electrodiphilus]